MTITRRELAKGTAWAAPVILTTTAAPAMAASPCAAYRTGQPLPASAFTTTYINITADLDGIGFDRKLGIDFGFKISDEARACGVTSGSINSYNSSGTSRIEINDPKNTKFDLTNGLSVPANGSVGVVDTSCGGGLNNTQACGTSGGSPYRVNGSSGTRSYWFTRISLYRSVTVAGYGTSIIYLNASMPTSGSPTYYGFAFSTSSAPTF